MSKKNFMSGLNSLLGEEQLQNNKAIKQESNKRLKLADNKEINAGIRKVGKEKATFNLSKELLQDLEDAWIQLRKARGDKRVSKTDIVEFSIRQTLADLKAIKQESKLYGSMVNNKDWI